MPSEQAAADRYFDTPARAERLQLLLHLVRNAGDVIYLRAPAGAGKTRFARRLLEILGSDMATVWVRGGLDIDVAATAADQLGLSPEDISHWPDALLDALGDQELFLVVDDADQLDLAAVERLAALHTQGGRLLLLGRGGLAQTTRDWDVQFVDLPSFSGAETSNFLRSHAAEAAEQLDEDMVAALHRAAHGLPGPLLEAMKEVRTRRSGKGQRPPAAGGGRGLRGWQWVAGAGVVAALVVVLALQDQINALLEPPAAPRVAGLQRDHAAPEQSSAVVQHSAVAGDTQPAGSALPGGAATPREITPPESAPGLPVSAAEPPAAVEPPAKEAAPEESAAVGSAAELTATEEVPAAKSGDAAMADAVPAAEGAAAGQPTVAAADQAGDSLDAVMRDALSAVQAEAPAGVDEAAGQETAPAGDAPVTAALREDRPAPGSSVDAPTPPASVAKPAADSNVAVVALPATRRPAPVEERVVPTQAKAATPPPTTKPAPPAVASVEERTVSGGGHAWLKSRQPGHYTLQLVGARDRVGVLKFVSDHGISQPYAIFERQLDGRPWYSLVAGDYPDRAAAAAAREKLPKAVERAGVWPRTFESIFKTL